MGAVEVSRKDPNTSTSIPLADITNINLSTVDTSVLGAWLSDTGPVHLPPRCLCKGTCVRNCSCRTAGTTCSSRCSCKPSKCKLRTEASQLAGGSRPIQSQITNNVQINAESSVASENFGNSCDPPAQVSKSADVEDQRLLTPSSLSTTFFSSNSTTRKKKKKLFTESIGPQEI